MIKHPHRRAACLVALLLLSLFCISGCSTVDISTNASSNVTTQRVTSGSYTFVWMSDTQIYSESYPKIYEAMTSWIADNVEKENLKFVFHTGDVVNQCGMLQQWQNADQAMKRLDGVIPYSILAGNHDLRDSLSDYTTFLSYFGQQRFADTSDILWYQEGQARAQLLDVGSTRYLILALGYQPDADMIDWANSVLADNADIPAILTTHDYLETDGSLSETGTRLYDKIVLNHANVHLVLCGHNHGAVNNVAEIDDNQDGVTDRTVYQLLADYQETPQGGNGFLRLLTIDEAAQEIRVTTYSPYLDQFNCYSPEEDEFSFSISDWFHS